MRLGAATRLFVRWRGCETALLLASSAANAGMSSAEMAEAMQMDDARRFATVMVDQLEWGTAERPAAWDARAWYGGDTDKLWLRTEGTHVRGEGTRASAELLWDHAAGEWWGLQLGARNDLGAGPPRTWMALGLEGVAPYWFVTEATVYVGEGGRTAARIKTEYELYLTQRVVLQPKAEANLYGHSDPALRLGSGLSDLELGVRLRYEIRRELAPYAGFNWSRLIGSTAGQARAGGHPAGSLNGVLGVKFWF